MNMWKNDAHLHARLTELVTENFKQSEILSFITHEYPSYSWSLRTLQRRLNFFAISHNDSSVSPDELFHSVREELKGPGELLGYRAMHKKIRSSRGIRVKRQDVYETMNLLCPEKLEERQLIAGKRKRFHKRHFTSKGSNWMWSIDGHDKLMGKCKSEFPLAIHAGIDSFSRKILWLIIWPSNSIPELPAKLYFDAIIEFGYVPNLIRSDRGSENVIVSTMHNYLHSSEPGESKHIFGSSTTNQVIEQWWRGFRERHGEFYKELIIKLAIEHHYDEYNKTCRVILAYVFIGLIQKSMDTFKQNWNTHRIRKQDIYRPCGIPDFLYAFPEKNGGMQCGMTPEPADVEYVRRKTDSITKLKFIDNDLEHELNAALIQKGIHKITDQNAVTCYALLYDSFKNRNLNFDYT